MSKIPSFESLRAKTIGHDPVFFKTAQEMPGGLQLGQGMGGVTTGRPDEMQAPESADEAMFENDFSTLAFQFVQDRAPALMPYMIGFEVVDRTDDGSKAVGIYGYKVDDDFYYIPVFFLNNQIRGVDMILNKKTNSFMPLTENWVDYIVDRHSVTLGKSVSGDVTRSLEQPDLTFLKEPKNQALPKSAEANGHGDAGITCSHVLDNGEKPTVISNEGVPQAICGKAHTVSDGRVVSRDELKKIVDRNGNKKAAEDHAPEEMWSLKQAWAIMRDQAVKMASEDPLLKDMFNGVLRAVKGAPFKKQAEATYIKGFLRTVGGPEAQVSLLKSFKNIKFANAALSFYENLSAFDEENVKEASVHKDILAKKAAAAPKLRIVTAAENVDIKDETSLSEEDARQVLTRGFTIQDARPAETTAEMTDDTLTVDFEKRFSTPTEVGKYSFVMSDGKLREGFLLSLTHSMTDCDNQATVIYFPEDKVVAKAKAENLLVDTGTASKANGTSFKELFDQAKANDEVEPNNQDDETGKAYLFLSADGQAFGPIRVSAVFKDGDELSYGMKDSAYDFVVRSVGNHKNPDFGNWDISDRFHDADGYRKDHVYVDRNCGGECCCDSSSCQSVIKFIDGISRPSRTSKGVLLPASWKVVECTNVRPWAKWLPDEKDEDHRKRSDKCDQLRLEYEEKYSFGSPTCILASLSEQGVMRVKIASVGPNEYHLHVDGFRQTPRMTYKEAALKLVANFGARPADAFKALEKAASEGLVRVLISGRKTLQKAAQVGVSMPAMTPQAPAVDDYTGIPVYEDPYTDIQHGQFTGVPSLPEDGGLTRGIANGSEVQRAIEGPTDGMMPIDQAAQELADQAAQAGQRHVFDQAAVGGLSKVYDTSAVVDSYIPNFMDSLDRLGRILFLFYWKHEDFNTRYGSDDVVEMEDRLRSVFKQLGDLTLKLKEKAVRED